MEIIPPFLFLNIFIWSLYSISIITRTLSWNYIVQICCLVDLNFPNCILHLGSSCKGPSQTFHMLILPFFLQSQKQSPHVLFFGDALLSQEECSTRKRSNWNDISNHFLLLYFNIILLSMQIVIVHISMKIFTIFISRSSVKVKNYAVYEWTKIFALF